MTDATRSRVGLTVADLAILSEREALNRLDLLASVSRLLETAVDDYHDAVEGVTEACLVDFADLCVIELFGPDGGVRAESHRHNPLKGLKVPSPWVPVGPTATPGRTPVLVFAESPVGSGKKPKKKDQNAAYQVLEQVSAESLLVVPIVTNNTTTGWFVAATGTGRRGFRPSALKVAEDIATRIGTTVQRVNLHREIQLRALEQSRSVHRIRRLASAATNLAGAASPQAVLETACIDACVIQDANGAIARWYRADGSVVEAEAGDVDVSLVEVAFDSVTTDRIGRGRRWIAYPLASTDPWQRGALAVFVDHDLTGTEEPVLSSLASLIPVAFERALGTEAAVKHEARLRALIDASPVFMLELDALGNVAMANRSAQELFGWAPNPDGWKLDDEARRELADLAIEAVRDGYMVTHTTSLAHREFAISAAPLPALSPTDAPSALLAGADLTEMRRAEHALVQAQRLDAMGQVAGRVAHDFNNLLTLIIGYASILRKGIGDDRQLNWIANIEDAAKRAAKLTQQMLDMTHQKVDSGVVIDLGRAVTGLETVLSGVAGPKVDLRIRTSRNVIKVRLDPSEMEQILVNLVINACDAMDREGRVEVAVRLVALPPSEMRQLSLPAGPLAMLTVSDNGPGMPPEVLARCLEPFFTTKGRGHGSGLGLPTVYGLVRERGGQMQIDSEVGRGTRIRLWLPLVRDAAVSRSGKDAEQWPEGRKITGRVLLVEDEADLRPIAVEALSTIGLEVVACSTAEEALEHLHSEKRFDGLVTDVLLPGMSGIDLARTARKTHKGLPVVYMTGYTGANDAPPDKSDPVIRKPYQPDLLCLRVAEMVQVGRVRSRRH
jgi:signal transduction histidine kinase/CheY-like chemotaxis protein